MTHADQVLAEYERLLDAVCKDVHRSDFNVSFISGLRRDQLGRTPLDGATRIFSAMANVLAEDGALDEPTRDRYFDDATTWARSRAARSTSVSGSFSSLESSPR